jgi:hypothetical protein
MKKREAGVSSANDLDDRFSRLEELMNRHSHELAIQFERIAQIQGDLDRLRGGLLETQLRNPPENRTGKRESSNGLPTQTNHTNSPSALFQQTDAGRGAAITFPEPRQRTREKRRRVPMAAQTLHDDGDTSAPFSKTSVGEE